MLVVLPLRASERQEQSVVYPVVYQSGYNPSESAVCGANCVRSYSSPEVAWPWGSHEKRQEANIEAKYVHMEASIH